MSRRIARFAVALAAALVAAPAAHAFTCYVVIDRSDNTIYRDTIPPVDMSETGIPAREAMRARGEFMLFYDVDACPRVEFFTGAAGSVGVRLDQTLAPTTAPAAKSAPANAAKTPSTQQPPRR
ncbi:MAG TPA: hypothetical protein VF196_02325 [Casimicrobiaceae bacterium]